MVDRNFGHHNVNFFLVSFFRDKFKTAENSYVAEKDKVDCEEWKLFP